MPIDFISTATAARVLDLTVRRVQQLCQSKQIASVRVGNAYLIKKADVLDFEKIPVGRPPG